VFEISENFGEAGVAGTASWRSREKFCAAGGPSGGDCPGTARALFGSESERNTLLRSVQSRIQKRIRTAWRGSNCTCIRATTVILQAPCGTLVFDAHNGETRRIGRSGAASSGVAQGGAEGSEI